jgi:threonine synthase
MMKTRKELKEEYKQMKFKMGVFQIKNCANGKVFSGHSTDLTAIWHAQKMQLNNGMHANSELQNDWRTFGADNFLYEILEEYKQPDDSLQDINKELKALEEIIIETLQPFGEKGYNKRSKK